MVRDPLLDRLRDVDPAEPTVSENERRRSRALAAAEMADTRQRSRPTPRPRARRRRWLPAVGLGGALAALVVAVGPLTGGSGPDDAQAAAIAALATRAADVPPAPATTDDRPYAYVRQAVTGPTVIHLPAGRLAPARYRQLAETWQRADGSGRRRTVDLPLAYDDPDDAAAAAAARPEQRRSVVRTSSLRADDAARATNGIGRPLLLSRAEIAGLPDDASALDERLTEAVRRAERDATHPASVRLGPARTVTDLAADLLSVDTVRPAARAALVRVVGRAPGVRALPGMRDPEGRSGTGLEWRSAEGHRTVLLIDPGTTRVLAQRTSIPDAAAGRPSEDGSSPTIDVWTTILRAAAVTDVDKRP